MVIVRPPRNGEAERERDVSEDKVTYPSDEEGGQPELLRRPKRIYAGHGGLLEAAIQPTKFSEKKEPEQSRRRGRKDQKRGKKI